jgi:sigma-E factor negative regulatory protein RseB
MSICLSFRSATLAVVLALSGGAGWGQPPTASPGHPEVSVVSRAESRSITDWLVHMQQASRTRNYVGTMVVSSDATLASARIWHACDGQQQIERVDSLTGPPRSTFRRDDHVVTFLQDSKTALIEKRASLGTFPSVLQGPESSIGEHYASRLIGEDRVAGFDADVVLLRARDRQRYGYRIWSEKRTGLVVKLQTLDLDGKVLEQAAFSELQLDAPVRMSKLSQMMAKTSGYRQEVLESAPTDPGAEGWSLSIPVAGFKSMRCIKRPMQSGTVKTATVQWVFSDGLASVSLFLEPYDTQIHVKEGLLAVGATQSLTQRVDEWWLTAVGEVPPVTLKAFAQALERKK